MISAICTYGCDPHERARTVRERGSARRSEAQAQPRMWLSRSSSPSPSSSGRATDTSSSATAQAAQAQGPSTPGVYRILRQLEKDGLVSSGWDTSKEGPARRLYSLTDAGRALPHLNVWAASLRGYQAMLGQFFQPLSAARLVGLTGGRRCGPLGRALSAPASGARSRA